MNKAVLTLWLAVVPGATLATATDARVPKVMKVMPRDVKLSIVDGKPVNSCLMLGVEAHGAQIDTIEGLQDASGRLHPLQESFIQYGGAQCGFCTPGMIMMAKALLDENPRPTEDEVRFAIAGNICRCTGYTKIVEAILAVAHE